MKKLLIMSLGASALLFISCRKSATEADDEGANQLIEINNCASSTINGKSLYICFDSLLTESRCPSNVVCVWAGYALIRMTLSVGGQHQSFNLATSTLPPHFRNDTTVLGYKVKLLALTPYPGNNSQEPYRAEVEITQ